MKMPELKLLKLKSLDPKKRVRMLNHAFFASAGLLFVAQQFAFHGEARPAEVAIVAQALHLQPRTPPPAYDADQLSVDEVDVVDMSIRPEGRPGF